MTGVDQPLCLVGQALVDVTLPQNGNPYKMRLGGILHAARAMWAIGQPYVLAYAAPAYLSGQVERYALKHGAVAVQQFASVDGCPNVVLIAEVKEAGHQGYEYLAHDEAHFVTNAVAVEDLVSRYSASDLLAISSGFDLTSVLKAGRAAGARLHVDPAGESDDWTDLLVGDGLIDTLSLSTSSFLFHQRFNASPEAYWSDALRGVATAALLKENRGGSRLRVTDRPGTVSAPAFSGHTEHSVGVGDCFDAVWVTLRRKLPDVEALAYASLVAAEYAATTYPDRFREAVTATLQLPAEEVVSAVGVLLPWERRATLNIYVAAPDFDYADQRPIDALAAALAYHNFVPRLPVRENGQADTGTTSGRRAELLAADLTLLDTCQIVVAVLTYNDPGTLIEIGLACQRNIPVIVYDPAGRADNLMLTGLAMLVTDDLEKVIACVYREAAKIVSQGEDRE